MSYKCRECGHVRGYQEEDCLVCMGHIFTAERDAMQAVENKDYKSALFDDIDEESL